MLKLDKWQHWFKKVSNSNLSCKSFANTVTDLRYVAAEYVWRKSVEKSLFPIF